MRRAFEQPMKYITMTFSSLFNVECQRFGDVGLYLIFCRSNPATWICNKWYLRSWNTVIMLSLQSIHNTWKLWLHYSALCKLYKLWHCRDNYTGKVWSWRGEEENVRRTLIYSTFLLGILMYSLKWIEQ